MLPDEMKRLLRLFRREVEGTVSEWMQFLVHFQPKLPKYSIYH